MAWACRTPSRSPSPRPLRLPALVSSLAACRPPGLWAVTSFSLTLRRADNVPLGLDVLGDCGSSSLVVVAVRPDGAAEAWNRQCTGESRMLWRGDRIVAVNDAVGARAIHEECLTKHLLRLTVQREPGMRRWCEGFGH